MKERQKLLQRQRVGTRGGMSDQEIRKLDADIRQAARDADKKAADLKVIERSISDRKRLAR